jgi:hypothetical protein
VTAYPIADFLRDVRAGATGRASFEASHDKGDLVWWTDLNGREREAVVHDHAPSGESVPIRITDSLPNPVVFVQPGELSPRTACPEGTET